MTAPRTTRVGGPQARVHDAIRAPLRRPRRARVADGGPTRACVDFGSLGVTIAHLLGALAPSRPEARRRGELRAPSSSPGTSAAGRS